MIALACDLHFFRSGTTTGIAAVFLPIGYVAKAGCMCTLSHVFRHVEAFSSSCLRLSSPGATVTWHLALLSALQLPISRIPLIVMHLRSSVASYMRLLESAKESNEAMEVRYVSNSTKCPDGNTATEHMRGRRLYQWIIDSLPNLS